MMRTTVTLDPDVEAKLTRIMREQGLTFKEAINQAVRAGLGGGNMVRQPFTMVTKKMGFNASVDFDRALTFASTLEDEEHLRQLQLGK